MEKQSPNQKKIALAQSEHSETIIELMKDCLINQKTIIAKTEWETIVNAITLEVQGNMLQKMVTHIEFIKKGGLLEPK